MAYDFSKTKKKQFGAIEKDKETLNLRNQRTAISNATFGTVNISDFMPSGENNEISYIDLGLIKQRENNDFNNISNLSLKTSIRHVGLFFPVLLRTSDNGKYTIISGHRRYQAFKELLSEYQQEKAAASITDKDTKEIDEKIEYFSKIKAIVYTVVEDNSELLGTDPKYITKAQEEEIYLASNTETRNNLLSGKSSFAVIKYFYDMIMNDKKLYQELLDERNKDAQRKASSLNMPIVIRDFIVKDLNFRVAPSTVWQVVSLIEGEDQYPKYHKKAMKRLKDGEPVKTVFKDYEMAVKINKHDFDEDSLKEEYATRIEKGDEKIGDIYNEVFDVRTYKKESKTTYSKKDVLDYLYAIKQNPEKIDEIIATLEK